MATRKFSQIQKQLVSVGACPFPACPTAPAALPQRLQEMAVPLASPARTQHRCSPSPQSRRITRPALSPFPAPATDCDERIDRSVQCVTTQLSIYPRPCLAILLSLLPPPLPTEQSESLAAKSFRARGVGFKTRPEKRRTALAAAGRLLSVASVSVKRRRRRRRRQVRRRRGSRGTSGPGGRT